MKKLIAFFLIVFTLLSAGMAGCTRAPEPGVPSDPAPAIVFHDVQEAGDAAAVGHLELGNPTAAFSDESLPENYLISREEYALSYHRERGIPNWVSWHLDRESLGSAPRTATFSADAVLNEGWYRVTSSDYTNSGFDRGHNCPSADRTANAEDNEATFLMTNIIPQAPNVNQQAWAELEDYCRTLVQDGERELYIIMGSSGSGGTGSKGYAETIADGKITVPARVWKVIVVLETGDADASRVAGDTRLIAVDIPNDNSVSTRDWGRYRTTVDDIESRESINLLSRVPTAIQREIESRSDEGPTR